MFAVSKNIKQKMIPIAATIAFHLIIALMLWAYTEIFDLTSTKGAGLSAESFTEMDITKEDVSVSLPPIRDMKKDKKKTQKIPKKQVYNPKTSNAQILQKTEQASNDDEPTVTADTLKKEKVTQQVAQNKNIKPDSAKVDSTLIWQKIKEAQMWNQTLEFEAHNGSLIRNFKLVYPMAKKAQEILDGVDAQLNTIRNPREKRKFLKQKEADLFYNYEAAIKHMSFSQGKIFLKLLSRQTHRDAYSIIKDYKGDTYAIFWQNIGKLFNADLKTTYDPMGQDSILEKVVIRYESGQLGR